VGSLDPVQGQLDLAGVAEQIGDDDRPTIGERGSRGERLGGAAIVTGALQFVGDLSPEGLLYGGFLRSDYHEHLTNLQRADVSAATEVPGVVKAGTVKRDVAVIGESFTAVVAGLEAVAARWRLPRRPVNLNLESEIRAGAEFVQELESEGDVNDALRSSDIKLTESYLTQFTTQAPIETDTAVASSACSSSRLRWIGQPAR